MAKGAKWLPYPGSKWQKHKVLLQSTEISPHLPETHRLERQSLEHMLHHYTTLYLKPSLGGGGKGIFRIQHDHRQKVRIEDQRTGQRSIDRKKLIPQLIQTLKNKNYMVQQGIELMRVHHRPADLRCLLYKKNGKWHHKGIMGKVAAPKRYTTNLCRGGTSITLDEALRHSFNYSASDIDQMEQKLRKLGLNIAHALNQYFPNMTQLGIDFALDVHQQIWMLEANSRPQYELFKQHADRNLYAQIDREIKRLRRKN